jgi:large subunit ribosomal protein L10
MAAPAKALADSARESRVLEIRGGVMQGRAITAEEVQSLASLPPLDVLRGQVLAAIIAPLTAIAGLISAPLQNLHGLLDARIEQLGGAEEAPVPAAEAEEQASEEEPEPVPEAPSAEGDEPTQAAAPADASEETPDNTEETS